MAGFSYRPVLTDIGLQKVNDAIANNTDLVLTEIALGDATGDFDYEPVSTMTSLVNELSRIRVRSLTLDIHLFYGEVVARISGMLLPSDAVDATIREAGVYDSDGDLIIIARTSILSAKTPEALRTGIKIRINKKLPEAIVPLLKIDGTSNEQILTSEELSGHVTQTFNVHRLNKEQIGLGEVEDVSDSGAPLSQLTIDMIDDTKMATGFIDRLGNKLHNANNTLTLIINYPTGVYKKGIYYPLTDNASINLGYQAEWEEVDGEGVGTGVIHPAIPAESGEFFIGLDVDTNELYKLDVPDMEIDILVAYVICNTIQGIISINDERHLASKNINWYKTQELRNKISWLNGGVLDLTEDNDTDISFDISSPILMANKDLNYNIVNGSNLDNDYEQVLTNAFPPVLYLNIDDEIVYTTGVSLPWLNSNNTLLYNNTTSGTLLEVDNGKYINYLIIYTADVVAPVKMLVGHVMYSTETAAALADTDEFDYLLSRMRSKVAYKVIMHKDSSYILNIARARAARVENKANNTSLRNAMAPKGHEELGDSRFEDDQHGIDNIEGLRDVIDTVGQIQSVSTSGNLSSEVAIVDDTVEINTWQSDTRLIGRDKNVIFIDLIGSVYSSTSKWTGAALASNGKIYCTPLDATQVLEVDPITKTTALIGSVYSSTNKWLGAVLAPNGKLYCVPFNATQVLEIDPIARTTTLIGSVSSSTGKWADAALAPNGKIYCSPYYATQVLEIDPVTKTTALIGSVYSGTNKWYGAVLAPNGKLYCVPFTATQVLEIDPIAKTTTLIGSVYSGDYKWTGATLAPNGKIYCAPANATQVLEIDPILKTTTLIGSVYSGEFKWYGAALAPNGKIYCVPYNATQVLEIDPVAKATTLIGNVYSSIYKWESAVLAANGKIYCIPYYATQVLEIDPITKTTDYGSYLLSGQFKS